VQEVTQPQGHSTSGSHERYKSEERLSWESEFDCNVKMEEWMISNAIITAEEIEEIKKKAKELVRNATNHAWEVFTDPIKLKKIEIQKLLVEAGSKISDPVIEK